MAKILVRGIFSWSGVALDGRWTSWNKRGRQQCNSVIFTQNSLDDCSGKRSNPTKVDIRVFGEPIGLDLYCLLSHLDPNESLGIKIDQHRGQFHDSGLCMTSRHTRRNAQGELVTFTNQELARLERTNRQQPRQTDTTMGDHANQDDLAAAMALMQQQMQQMQQTIQAQQDAAEQAALAQQEQQAQTKEESDCSKKENSSDAQKIDELTAKVDQLLKNNQGHVFSMEQPTARHIQNQNQRQPQSNPHAVPATGNSQPDELKGLGMMMLQLLQGQQVQAKALNQVTTEIDTRMGNMFTELNNKYDNLAIHIRKIDVQLAQTAESVKRQQETLPGRTDKNPRTEHCNAVEQSFAETILVAEENTEQSASSEVIAPSEPAETPPVRVYVPKVPYPIPPRHLMDPISEEQLIGFNKMVRRLPKELAFEDALQIRPLLQFFKHCRETQEEIKVLYIKALSTPALKVLPKVDDPGKFVFPCSIAGTTFKDALCDSGSCVNLVSKAILKVVPEKEHGDKEQGWRTRMVAKSEPPVALRTIMYYLLLHHITISVSKKKKKKEINVMEKGMKSKKHEPLGRSNKGVGTKRKVWSCIGWEIDQLEQKRQTTVQFSDFHAEQS
ncbi:hypothetical protein IGI04_018720 [Brassica rapa subsp. trilocularis]|uniref:Retrotransposon gag domain-containing protein n=1 Tax=Brassica rapa subsp. trilocularis TaxID=1813537 RepID=A0ABQ7MH81_BRACM|nr:hypothetical protein IGI04_018720 [Brassica rapa subsp. trilocularis]